MNRTLHLLRTSDTQPDPKFVDRETDTTIVCDDTDAERIVDALLSPDVRAVCVW